MPVDHNNIERILHSLDNVQKASAPDFFQTRLIARMERELASPQVLAFQWRPALLAACLAVVLGLNIAAISGINKATGPDSNGKKAAGSIDQFANEYNFQSGDLYQ